MVRVTVAVAVGFPYIKALFRYRHRDTEAHSLSAHRPVSRGCDGSLVQDARGFFGVLPEFSRGCSCVHKKARHFAHTYSAVRRLNPRGPWPWQCVCTRRNKTVTRRPSVIGRTRRCSTVRVLDLRRANKWWKNSCDEYCMHHLLHTPGLIS